MELIPAWYLTAPSTVGKIPFPVPLFRLIIIYFAGDFNACYSGCTQALTSIMKHFFLFLSFLAVTSTVNAQVSSIKGIIHNKEGTPISHVTVSIKGTSVRAVSREDGSFRLRNLPSGTHTLRVSSLEIETQELSVQVDKPEVERNITVTLKGDQDLGEVNVLGKSKKRELETQGFAVNIIETKDAALRNLQTNELLDRSAGIRVRQNGGLGSAVNYNLNGMSGNSVRIFIDGIPISTYGASFNLNSVPPALIERIEVYKGVIPAHLADDALGGAINVILKKDIRNNLTASTSYGSFNTTQSNLSGTFRNAKNGLTLKASGFHNYSDNDYEVWGRFVRNILPNGRYDYVRARRFNDAYRSLGGQVEAGFTDVKWADQFLIGLNASQDYNEIQHGVFMTIPYKGRFTEANANVLSLIYRKRDLFTKGLSVNLNATRSERKEVVTDTVSWNYNWFRERSLGLDGEPIRRPSGAQQGAPTINHINRSITSVRSGLNYEITGQHRLVLGHILNVVDRGDRDDMRNAVEREFVGTRYLAKNVLSFAYEMDAFNAKLKTNLFGKYYQQAIERVEPSLVNTGGEQVRVDDVINSNRSTTGYGLATSYSFQPTLVLLASAERAVRMPSEGEVFGSPGDNITENIGIRPEVSNNLNVGVRLGPYRIEEHQLSFATSGFLRDTRDKIVQRINPRLNDAIQTNPFENLGRTKAIGFEVEANYSFSRKLNVSVNGSRFNSVFNLPADPQGRPYDYYNRQLPNEPFFTINSMVQYTLEHLLGKNSLTNFYYNFGFVDRFYTTWMEIEDFQTPQQYIQDLGISYAFPNRKLVLSFDAKNIFDRQVYDNFAVQKPGRAFYLKLNYSIHNF